MDRPPGTSQDEGDRVYDTLKDKQILAPGTRINQCVAIDDERELHKSRKNRT